MQLFSAAFFSRVWTSLSMRLSKNWNAIWDTKKQTEFLFYALKQNNKNSDSLEYPTK